MNGSSSSPLGNKPVNLPEFSPKETPIPPDNKVSKEMYSHIVSLKGKEKSGLLQILQNLFKAIRDNFRALTDSRKKIKKSEKFDVKTGENKNFLQKIWALFNRSVVKKEALVPSKQEAQEREPIIRTLPKQEPLPSSKLTSPASELQVPKKTFVAPKIQPSRPTPDFPTTSKEELEAKTNELNEIGEKTKFRNISDLHTAILVFSDKVFNASDDVDKMEFKPQLQLLESELKRFSSALQTSERPRYLLLQGQLTDLRVNLGFEEARSSMEKTQGMFNKERTSRGIAEARRSLGLERGESAFEKLPTNVDEISNFANQVLYEEDQHIMDNLSELRVQIDECEIILKSIKNKIPNIEFLAAQNKLNDAKERLNMVEKFKG